MGTLKSYCSVREKCHAFEPLADGQACCVPWSDAGARRPHAHVRRSGLGARSPAARSPEFHVGVRREPTVHETGLFGHVINST